jgi:hypothetical protein
VTKKDRWPGKWQVHSTQWLGKYKFLGPGTFRLSPVRDPKHKKQVAYYRVTIIDGMHNCWKGARLFPRGSEVSISPVEPLPTWNSGCEGKWGALATRLRKSYVLKTGFIPGINPRIERLECDIRPMFGKAEALTLVRVDSAVEGGRDLLILILKSLNDIRPREDGTGHGSGPPH